MGVFIEVKGGAPVYALTERFFHNGKDAMAYIKEWLPDAERTKGKRFDVRKGMTLTLSHSLTEIRANRDVVIPDNELSSAVKDRLTSARKMHMPLTANTSNSTKTAKPEPTRVLKEDAKARTAKRMAQDAVNDTTPDTSTKADTSTKTNGTATDLVVLKDICRRPEVNLEPRIARQKLRKAYAGNDKQRWEWAPAEVAGVIAILTGKGK